MVKYLSNDRPAKFLLTIVYLNSLDILKGQTPPIRSLTLLINDIVHHCIMVLIFVHLN